MTLQNGVGDAYHHHHHHHHHHITTSVPAAAQRKLPNEHSISRVITK